MEAIVECDGSHLWTVRNVDSGNLETLEWREIMQAGPEHYLFPKSDGSWARVKGFDRINPKPVRCIEVDDPSHLYALTNGIMSHNTGGGKSVLQRNMILHCIAHADEIKFLGIDLKMVELSAYKKYEKAVLGIATNLDDAVEIMRFAKETMMKRYSDMKEAGVQNFLNMPSSGPALLVMIDEAGELLDTSGGSGKALSADTIIYAKSGLKTMSEIRVGDNVLGEDGDWHEVLRVYNPGKQPEYKLSFRRASDGATEQVKAGSEHLWTVTIDGNDEIMNTKELHRLWLNTPTDKRSTITFKRAAVTRLDDDISKKNTMIRQ